MEGAIRFQLQPGRLDKAAQSRTIYRLPWHDINPDQNIYVSAKAIELTRRHQFLLTLGEADRCTVLFGKT